LILFLDKNVENSGFIVGFLTCLHDASDIRLDGTKVSEVYKLTLSKALKVFKIDTLAQPRSASGYSQYNKPKDRGPECGSVAWETMVKLLKQCDTIGVDTSEILEVLKRRALGLREDLIESMYRQYFLPLISSLCLGISEVCPATLREQRFIV
jgi:hypothetical protein